MNNATRRCRIAQRFLISILQRYWRETPAVLREWTEEAVVLAGEENGDLPQFDLDEVVGRRVFF